MSTWIKAGFWEKLCKNCKGYKGWLNLDQFVKDNAGPSYKVYTALLTQEGTNPPVATVFENTIGNIVWTRNFAGFYSATLPGAFTLGKTFVSSWLNYKNSSASITTCATDTIDECSFYTYYDNVPVAYPGTLFDLGGDGLFVEIRVYP